MEICIHCTGDFPPPGRLAKILHKWDFIYFRTVFDFSHRLWVFENSVLRKMFGPKKNLTRDWRELRIVELLRSSLYGIRVIKSRRMGLEEHVACMGERIGATELWWGNLRAREHLEELGVEGRIILK